MNTVLSPIESEFATVEEAEAYDRWFRAMVQASLATNAVTPHDQVMAELREIIETKRRSCFQSCGALKHKQASQQSSNILRSATHDPRSSCV